MRSFAISFFLLLSLLLVTGCVSTTSQTVSGSVADVKPIINGVMVLSPGEAKHYTFDVPAGSNVARILGTFTSTGEIEVLILSAHDFDTWKKSNEAPAHYEIRSSEGNLDVELPPRATYYLVYSNRFLEGPTKKVTSKTDLFYSRV